MITNKMREIITNKIENLDKTTLKQLIMSVVAILTMTGRVTMLSISRWSDMSYKTVGRFLDKKIDWLNLNYSIIKDDIEEDFIIGADECTVSKSGHLTHNIGYFYSGLQKRAIKGIQFLVFSIINSKEKRSYPLFVKQLKQQESKDKTKPKKKRNSKAGRPKGSKNKIRENIELTGVYKIINSCLNKITKTVKLPKNRYLVYDGMMGCNSGVVSAKRAKFELISKLKSNSRLYFKYEGKQNKIGNKRKYGEKVDFNNMDEKYLKESIKKDNIDTKIYQFEALSKTIYCPLNIVLIVSKNLKTDKISITVLFSTDLNLEYKKIIDYYSSRFQIEFNFRDSKQFFGLEDFMNVTKRRVNNFANLSLFMNNATYLLSKVMGFKEYSINDLKTLAIAEKYAIETLKLYGENADAILIDEAINQISEFAMIHKEVA